MSAIDKIFNQDYVASRIAAAKARAVARDIPAKGSHEHKALLAEKIKSNISHWSYDPNAHQALIEKVAPIKTNEKIAA